MLKKEIGSRFKKIAEELFDNNISELARTMGMSPQSFNKYAQGETLPGTIVLKRVLELGINLNWLLAGIPPMRISQIKEAGVISFTNADIEEYGGEKPTELKLSQLNPEVYNSPIKMMSYVIKDFEQVWEKEGVYLPDAQKEEALYKMLEIIIHQATNAKKRLTEN